MTDYLPLISRAVEGLDKSTGEARRALYERARNALVTQLRSVEPALSESEITRERLALEDSIRKVEADAARKARVEPREARTPAPAAPPRRNRPAADVERSEPRRVERKPPPAHDDATDAAAARRTPPSARERLLNARAPSLREEGIKGFRNVVSEVHDLGGATAKSAQSARDARDTYGSTLSRSFPPAAETTESSSYGFEPEPDGEEFVADHDDARQSRGQDGAYHTGDDRAGLQPARYRQEPSEDGYPRPPRSYRGLVRLAVALIILAGLVVTISWQWPHVTGAFHYVVARLGSRQAAPPPHEAAVQPKFSARVPQEQNAAQPSTPTAPNSQAAVPAVAQRVVLYEEDPNNSNGKRFVGSALWRTQTVSPGAGQAPELAVHADVTIPERHMTMSFSLRRNTDQALPASHTIEIQFTLPADFPGGGVANVPGILMKQSEQARGTPLAGLAVKVTNGFFLIGLSAVATDVQRNIDLLKDRPWFDIPIVYANGGRAILAMEKGPPGERAFADAFAAWEKK